MSLTDLSLQRRTLLGLGAAGVAAGVAAGATGLVLSRTGGTSPISPDSRLVSATERARPETGRVVSRTLRAAPAEIDLGGRTVSTWAFDGRLPGSEIRASLGDRLRVSLQNDLPATTTVHWHGLALRNDMDGVPGLTQPSVAAGARFDYDFLLSHPGTYWFHPHVGMQLDTGLYAPLIIEDPEEPGRYDEEVVLVLDDWTDGWGESPDAIFARMQTEGMRMGGMGMNGMNGMGGMDMMRPSEANPLGPDTGDVSYPAHLINGRLPLDPYVVRAKPGQRLRLRIINAGSDTAYRFAVGGHRLNVTHTDGFPVEPVEVDTLILGMGERYDVVVEVQDGDFAIVAAPEGKRDPAARAVLTTRPRPDSDGLASTTVAELTGQRLVYDDLRADVSVRLDSAEVDRELQADLSMSRGGREWRINNRVYADREPLEVRAGERVRLTMTNRSMMFHPMHLHGHTFAVIGENGPGPRKDTINVLPGESVVADVEADNPGQWLIHCHNAYHGELGMMTSLSYVE